MRFTYFAAAALLVANTEAIRLRDNRLKAVLKALADAAREGGLEF